MEYDVVIIGAGTAGLSAAIYVERSGKKAVCLEALAVGGQIINTPEVVNYPGIKSTSGYEFASGLYDQAVSLGAKVEYEKAVSISDEDGSLKRVTCESGKEFTARAVILATGAKNRRLGISGEKELTGFGVSYCATCDGGFFRGKPVAVNGGGNTALEDALFLSNYCSRVYLIHRRDSFRGEPETLKHLEERENVEIITNSTVTRLLGDKPLEGIEITNKLTGDVTALDVAGLFIAIGQEPDNSYFSNVVELSDQGYIKADETLITTTPGVFTAGDCRTKAVRQLATAASDGAVAGLAACSYIDSM